MLFQNFDCFCVSNSCEIGIYNVIQTIDQSLVYERVEEVHLFRCVLHHVADHIFQHALCKDHVVFQICKCDFRLDHPELCGMTCGVGILRTECRSECVNVAECLCISFTVQLSAYGKVCLFSEEIFGVIHASVCVLWYIVQIHSCYLEHLSCTLTVTSCDQRCVYIYKSSLLEEFVDRISGQRTNSEYCLEGIGSRTEMCDTS